jgi:hypothetical protein
VRANAAKMPVMIHHMAVMQTHHAVMMAMHPVMVMAPMVVPMMTRFGWLCGCKYETECGKHRKNT